MSTNKTEGQKLFFLCGRKELVFWLHAEGQNYNLIVDMPSVISQVVTSRKGLNKNKSEHGNGYYMLDVMSPGVRVVLSI